MNRSRISRASAIRWRMLLVLPLVALGCSSNSQPKHAASPKPRPTSSSKPRVSFADGDRAYIRIFKQEKRLELWRVRKGTYALYRDFPIYHFSGGLGPKLREGDCQAPEGFYFGTLFGAT